MIQLKALLTELTRDTFSSDFVPALSQGMIIGVLMVIIEVSFAGIIFSGPLAAYAPQAAGLTIFGAMIMCLCTGIFSSFPGIVSLPQDTPVAILSATALSIAATMGNVPGEKIFSTIAATIMFSAMTTGLCFVVIGRFKLANMVRFLPYPVIGGFLAASGAVLVKGSIGVMTDISPTLKTAHLFFTPEVVAHWIPGVLFGFVLYRLMHVRPHHLLLPGSLLAGLFLFFITLFLLGGDIEQARSGGWLLGSLPQEGLWPAFTLDNMAQVDPLTLLSHLPDILTVTLLSVVGMLLNLNGIELGVRRDLDMNRELMVEGAGNLLAGLGGGFAGYNTLSLSLLGPKTGTTTRLIPLTAMFCGATLFVGAELMTFFPKFLLGGMVLLIGLFFLEDWIFSGWKKLTPFDFAIVLVIVGTIMWFGFLLGVGLGLGLAILIFIVRISRTPVISGVHSGEDLHSTRERSIPDQAILRQHGSKVRIFTLTGYLFFGSAGTLGETLGNSLTGKNPPAYIILDLTSINGFDVSAVNSIQRIAQRTQAQNTKLILVGASLHLVTLLRNNTEAEVMADIHFAADVDEALEYCEEAIHLSEQVSRNEQTDHAADARRTLFDDTAEAMESHLTNLMHFEEIADKLVPFGTEKKYGAGEILLKQGQDPKGSFFLLWGSVSEYRETPEQKIRIRTLDHGNILAIPAVLDSWTATTTIAAKRDSTLLFLHRDAYRDLNKNHPELGQTVTRLLLEHACRQQRNS